MASGDTKTNQYLDIAANGSRADLPTDTCCETRSQTLIREVAERIMDVEDEVERLENNPDVADIVATYADLQAYDTSQLTDKDVIRVLQDETHDGDSTYYRWSTSTQTWTYIGESKQYTNFVGTDGTAAGEAGLVPAPATTDAGKFLSASGLWEEVAGGSTIELTSSDYNYPTDNPTSVALWLLEPGVYSRADNSTVVRWGTGNNQLLGNGVNLFIVNRVDNGGRRTVSIGNSLISYFSSNSDGSSAENQFILTNAYITTIPGASNDLVMSQNATTALVYQDPFVRTQTRIGTYASTTSYGVAIGYDASVNGSQGIALGGGSNNSTNSSASGDRAIAIGGAQASGANSVALGYGAQATAQGQFDIGASRTGMTTYGYNNSQYRLLTGLYDGQAAHDAATYGQVISYSAINGAGAPTTATEGKYVGQLYYDTTNEAMYFLKAIDTTTDPDTYTWEALGGGSSVNVVQATGTSTTDVMSQNAVTGMIFAAPSYITEGIKIGADATAAGSYHQTRVQIGNSSAVNNGNGAVVVGSHAKADGASGNQFGMIALGSYAKAEAQSGIALGAGAHASSQGEINVGIDPSSSASWFDGYGYNNSNYRLLTGLYDPQSAHDAATKGYVDTLVGDIETALDVILNGEGS